MGKPQDFKPGDPRINRKGRPPVPWTWSGLLRDLGDKEEIDEKTGKKKPIKQLIAEALTKEAKKGNVPAIKEYGDRIDGKAKQNHEVGGVDGNTIKVEIVDYGSED
ncbi:MAG: hypothetical protein K0U38_01455 [Epsilonproteobacteria bacterium]|nr:hypothetical protein [Campylobacterota bacterium]